jgi:hypothetical protein
MILSRSLDRKSDDICLIVASDTISPQYKNRRPINTRATIDRRPLRVKF